MLRVREIGTEPAEVAAAAALVTAMDEHYLGPGRARPAAEAAAMVAGAVATAEGARFAVAWDGPEPVGIACYAVLRPGHRLGGVVYLKDLFVPEGRRGSGIGRALLAFLAAFAAERGLGRLDFTTDAGNDGAVRLYERLGATRQAKIHFRIEGGALAALAASAPKD